MIPALSSDRALRLARPALGLLMALTLVIFMAGLVVRARVLSQVCLEPAAVCGQIPGRLMPEAAAELQTGGLSLRAYAALEIGKLLMFTSVWFAVGGLILVRRRDDWIALVAAFTLITFPTQFDLVPGTLVLALPALRLPVRGLYYLVGLGFPLFVALFPNGRWAPRWMRWVVVVGAIFGAAQQFGFGPPAERGSQRESIELLLQLSLLGLLLAAQMVRYRRYSTVTERIQTRWVVAGLAGALGIVSLLVLVTVLNLLPAAGWQATVISEMVYQTAVVLIPISVAIAILRFRLFDIDLLIRRTLIYSVLTGLLALAYLGSVLVLQSVFRALTGQEQSALVVVLSTLAIAALFGPLRGRVQRVIDRRFYRQKYDAARTLAGFASSARDETDLERLSAQLVEVVEETMQPASVGLWIKAGPRREARP